MTYSTQVRALALSARPSTKVGINLHFTADDDELLCMIERLFNEGFSIVKVLEMIPSKIIRQYISAHYAEEN